MHTLEEAKQYVEDNKEDGVVCPCCSQFAKIYERSITSAMAYGLILVYRNQKSGLAPEWLHVENYLKKQEIPSSIRGDFSKLRFWGLVVPKKDVRSDGSKRTGFYKMTSKGVDFVKYRITVPAKVRLFNNEFLGYTGKEINIGEALGKRFHYMELMGKDATENYETRQERFFSPDSYRKRDYHD